MNLKLFSIIFLTFLTDISHSQEKTCRISQLESKLKTLIGQFGMKEHKWPESEAEMKQWCKSLPKDAGASKRYARNCFSGISSTIMSVTIFAADKVGRTYCNNKLERSAYIAKGKCGNQAKTETSKCWNRLINIISNVKKLNESSIKIPTFCCAFFDWKDCTMNSFKKYESTVCTETYVQAMDQQISRGSLDPLNVFCSNYDESDKCDKITQNFDTTPDPRRYKTPFPAIIEVFDSL